MQQSEAQNIQQSETQTSNSLKLNMQQPKIEYATAWKLSMQNKPIRLCNCQSWTPKGNGLRVLPVFLYIFYFKSKSWVRNILQIEYINVKRKKKNEYFWLVRGQHSYSVKIDTLSVCSMTTYNSNKRVISLGGNLDFKIVFLALKRHKA